MKRPCLWPGCHELVESGRCDKHAASAPKRGAAYQRFRRADPLQRMVDGIRNTARWQQVRAIKLATNPLCEDPFQEHARRSRTVSAAQVHHIKGLRSHPELAFVEDNLMSVCARCHSKLEAQERRDAL